MSANAEVDGIRCTIQRQPDGTIRVEYPSPQINPMHGYGTGGVITHVIHPCQRHQYDRLNALLPPHEQTTATSDQPDQRPWWSLPAGERANLRE